MIEPPPQATEFSPLDTKIRIDANNNLFLDEKAVSLAELAQKFAVKGEAELQDKIVIIAHPEARSGTILRVREAVNSDAIRIVLEAQ